VNHTLVTSLDLCAEIFVVIVNGIVSSTGSGCERVVVSSGQGVVSMGESELHVIEVVAYQVSSLSALYWYVMRFVYSSALSSIMVASRRSLSVFLVAMSFRLCNLLSLLLYPSFLV
jgi:hypothetical protein